MNRLRQVLIVTAGLSAAGAVVGALAAISALAVMALTDGSVSALWVLVDREILRGTALLGAVIGAVAGPAVAWGLLRDVALGRAIAWTASGTVLGSVIGERFHAYSPYPAELPGFLLGAFLGFLAAAVALRVVATSSRRRRTATPAV